MDEPVFPRNNMTPCQNGSIFDCLILSLISHGVSLLSVAIFLADRCMSRSNSVEVRVANSLLQRKPKKARQQAAHNIILL